MEAAVEMYSEDLAGQVGELDEDTVDIPGVSAAIALEALETLE